MPRIMIATVLVGLTSQWASAQVPDPPQGEPQAPESGIIEFGLSVGVRWLMGDQEKELLRDAWIIPTDTTLQLDIRDRSDIVLSGVVTAFPFPGTGLARLGFVANINIADFGANNLSLFNRSIEGGLGFALRLHHDFALGVTGERVFSKSLRSGIEPGKKIIVDGQPITTIRPDDPDYFRDDNLSAVSVKFLYYF